MNLQDFACRISDIVWGGELGWIGEDGLEKLAETVRRKYCEGRQTVCQTGMPMPTVRSKWGIIGTTVLLETHSQRCTCSYCHDFRGTRGLALPKCKAWNSWRIIWWRYKGQLHDLRWTQPRWKKRPTNNELVEKKRKAGLSSYKNG